MPVRAFIRKEWDSESLNGDIWEVSDEDEDIEPLNSDEPSLLVEESTPPPGKVAFSIPSTLFSGGSALHYVKKLYWPSQRQLPYTIMLILLRTHPYHLFSFLDL